MPGILDYGLGSVVYGLDPAATAGSALTPSDVAAGQWIEQPKGTTRRYRAALVDPSTGLPVSPPYDPSDAVSAVVWDGGAGPVLAAPAAAWDGTTGSILFTVAASDLAGLEVQPYPLRLMVSVGGQLQAAWDGWLDVGDAPASAGPVPVYGTYQDLLRYCGSRMAQFLTLDQRAGFLEDRGEARKWLDGLILSHYRPKYTSYYGVGMAYTYGTGSLFPLGIGSLGYRTAPVGPDPTLRAALDANGLDVTDRVREVAARYAGSLILGRQSAAEWKAAAAVEYARAVSGATCLVAMISTDGDSKNVAVNLSVFDGRDV